MRKTKRLLSALTALTITASAFAGMVIPASASDELKKFDFDNTELTAETKGSKTVFEAIVSSEAADAAPGLFAAGKGKVLKLGNSANSAKENEAFGYKADLTKIDDGAVNLSYLIEPMQIRAGKNDVINVQFTDSELTNILGVTVGTSTAAISIDGGAAGSGTVAFGKYYKVSADLNFYNKTISAKITSEDETETMSTYSGTLTAKDLQYMYLPNTTWRYGYTALDDITVSTMDGAETVFTVKDTEGTVIEGATLVIGAKKFETDNAGKVTINLPAGTYSYVVSKAGTGSTDNSSGMLTVSEGDTEKTVDATLNANATMVDTTVNYYITGTTDAVPNLSSETINKAVGESIAASDLKLKDIVTDDSKYVYNALADNATALPYTVLSDNNIINVYFDKVDAVKAVTASYKVNGTEVANVQVPIDGEHYIGDSYTFVSNAYVTAADGKIYAVATDYIEDTPSTQIGNSDVVNGILAKDITLSDNTVVEYSVVLSPNAVFYGEWEDILAVAGVPYTETARYRASGGKMITTTLIKDFYEVPATGYYQVGLMGNSYTNRGTAIFKTKTEAENSVSKEDKNAIVAMKERGNGSAYGCYESKTVFLTEGDNLTIRGFGSSNTTDNLDYVLVRRIVSGDIVGADNISILDGMNKSSYMFDSGVVDKPSWTVTNAEGAVINGVTIDQNGVVTVASNAEAGKAVIKAEAGGITGEKEVTIAAGEIKSFNIAGASVVNSAEGKATYTVADVLDQFDTNVTSYVTPEFSIDGKTAPRGEITFNIPADKAGDAVRVDAVYDDKDNVLTSIKQTPVTLTEGEYKVSANEGTVVMLWKSLEDMIPVVPKQTAPAAENDPNVTEDTVATITSDGYLKVYKEGDVTITAKVMGKTVTLPVKIAKGSEILDAKAGEVDVSKIISYGASTYTVTFADGSTVVKPVSDNKITIEADEVIDGKMEIVPNYKFNFGNTDVDGYVTVNTVKANGYGFTAEPTIANGTGTGIQAEGAEIAGNRNCFEIDIPDGRYDMTFYKADTKRTHVKVNGYYTIPEADYMDGTELNGAAAEPLTAPGIYTKKDVNVSGGVARITADEWGKGVPLIAAVEITRKSDLEPRKTHIWLAGDSTVTNYRPTPSTKDDWGAGLRRTGWGQLFEYYLQDSVIVDNYAHSGDYSVNWYNTTFSSVLQNAQKGDYLLIQFGINDRADKNNCPQELMAEYLGKMVDECRAKGIIPVLVTPEICISQYGAIGEHEQSTGSGNAGWFNQNKVVAEAKDVLLIDLADLSGKLWAEMGKTWVDENYFLTDDNQHMSYQGAKLVAQLVATEIYDQIDKGVSTGRGESFSGIPVNTKSAANITYTDATDSTEKTIERTAVTFSLDKTADKN